MNDATAEPAVDRRADGLAIRVVSGVILAALALALAYLGGTGFAIVTGLTGALAWHEWLKFGRLPVASPAAACGWLTLVGGIATLLAAGPALGLVVIAAMAVATAAAAPGNLGARARSGLGAALLAGAALATIWLREADGTGRATLFWLFAVVWATDIGAYVLGKMIGGPRLAPRVSPGKTWAGACGGFAGGVAASIAVGFTMPVAGWIDTTPNAGLLIVFGALASVIAQLGDLGESLLKRRAGLKDSGHLIPGHGGVLDRLDGFLAVVLVLAIVNAALGSGAWLPWLP